MYHQPGLLCRKSCISTTIHLPSKSDSLFPGLLLVFPVTMFLSPQSAAQFTALCTGIIYAVMLIIYIHFPYTHKMCRGKGFFCHRNPSSTLGSYVYCQILLEPSKYSLQDIYCSLSVITEKSDFIQSELYKNSNFLHLRNNRILYYDCTNYYFELE